ncbi:DUF6232 family protein [Crocinitomicaceae bacterium]|nr:DUF6232 family protein [Crocinitomicaceae bacterium]
MYEKDLLQGESIITQSGGGQITLTNYRIRMTNKRFGKANIISIPIHKISSVEVNYHSFLMALIMGVLLIAFGLLMGVSNNGGPAMAGIIFIGIIGVIYYFVTRRHVVEITSDGGKALRFESKGLKQEALNKFLNQVEQAVREERAGK